MRKYIIRRALLMIPTLLILSVIIFGMTRLVRGDVVDVIAADSPGYSALGKAARQAIREDLGLTRPIHIQYFIWMGNVLRGDLGESLHTRTPAIQELRVRFPITLEIALMATVILTVWGLTIGTVSAVWQDSVVDFFLRSTAILGLSVPYFWTSILILVFGSIYLHWSPPLSYIPFVQDPWGNIRQFIWPSALMGIYLGSPVARMTRATLLEVMRQDYIRTARAKGLSGFLVINRHALKNAMISVITYIGLQAAFAIGGSTILETIWALPGVGRYLVESIVKRDYPIIQAISLFIAVVIMFINLVVDISYSWLDPRIRYQ